MVSLSQFWERLCLMIGRLIIADCERPGGEASPANADVCFKTMHGCWSAFQGLNERKQTNDFQATGSVALHSVRQHIQQHYMVSLSQFWEGLILMIGHLLPSVGARRTSAHSSESKWAWYDGNGKQNGEISEVNADVLYSTSKTPYNLCLTAHFEV